MPKDDNQFAACELCHSRKTKCNPTPGGGCEACSNASVDCIPRSRAPPGRRRGSRKYAWKLPPNAIASANQTQNMSGMHNHHHTIHSPDVSMGILPDLPTPGTAHHDYGADAAAYAAAFAASVSGEMPPIDFTTSSITPHTAPAAPDMSEEATEAWAEASNSSAATGGGGSSSSGGGGGEPMSAAYLRIFDLHMKVNDLREEYFPSAAELDACLELMEELGEALKAVPELAVPQFASLAAEPLTLLAFSTVSKSISLGNWLLKSLAACNEPPLSSSSPGSPSEASLWSMLSLTPSPLDAGGLAVLTAGSVSCASSEPGRPRVNKRQIMALMRLDMVLHDVSDFARQFSEALDHSQPLGGQQPHDVLGRIQTRNQECLASLNQLHITTTTALDSLKPRWS